MNTYRVVGRPLLASMFVGGGLDAVRHPETKVKKAEPIVVPLARLLPAGHDDPALLVRINGAVQVGAGLLLASGRYPRLTAATLIGSLVPTTYAGHRFWEEADDVARAQQQIHFLKNLGLLGGLLLALDDGGRSGTGAARSRRSAAGGGRRRRRRTRVVAEAGRRTRRARTAARQAARTAARQAARTAARPVRASGKELARKAGAGGERAEAVVESLVGNVVSQARELAGAVA